MSTLPSLAIENYKFSLFWIMIVSAYTRDPKNFEETAWSALNLGKNFVDIPYHCTQSLAAFTIDVWGKASSLFAKTDDVSSVEPTKTDGKSHSDVDDAASTGPTDAKDSDTDFRRSSILQDDPVNI